MNIQAEKLKLIEWLIKTKDESVIEKVKQIKESNKENDDWADSLTEYELSAIKRGLEDVENGEVVPHEEVKKMYEKWL